LDYLVAVLLPQLLHGLVFGAALGLLALGLTVIFGLLGVMNFAHGELYMLGAYAGIAVVGLTHSFWVALILAPLLVAALGAVTEIATLRPIYRRAPRYGLILTFGLALVFREGARQIWGGDMRRILPPVTGSTPLLGMTYPNYRLFLLGASSVLLLAIWLFFTRTRAGILVRAAVQDAEMLDGLGVNVPRLFTLTFAGSAALAALAGLLLAPVFTVYPQMGVGMILLAFIVVIWGGMGSRGGSVVAAFAIGTAQSLSSPCPVPIANAATTEPPIEPMPPKITTMNASRIISTPIWGYTVNTGARRRPARAASAAEPANVRVNRRGTLTPRPSSISASWTAARTRMPARVRVKKSQIARSSTDDAPRRKRR